MAGSEQEGVDGADPDLFLGATWVLTPEPSMTSGDAYSHVQGLVRAAGRQPGRGRRRGAMTNWWRWSRIRPT